MKKIIIKVPNNPLQIVKETPQERKERIQASGSALRTRVVDKNKKKYNRQQYKRGNNYDG